MTASPPRAMTGRPAQTTLRIVPVLALLVLIVGLGSRLHEVRGADRIRAVENGLLLNRAIKGQPGMPLRERMAYYRVPGVSVAVIDGGALAWARGYGVLESGGSRPVNAETRFQAASISKPVTATAALALVEQGRLRLDEDVNLRLTSWHLPDNNFTRTQKVTVERLLRHTAGVGVPHFGGYTSPDGVPTLLQVLDGQPPANSAPVRVERVPGGERLYSGGGYLVLQQLMTDVVGEPFPILLRRLVLGPIGMRQSTFEQPPADWQSSAASGHDAAGAPLDGRWHTYTELAAAGLWTTASDLARFAVELQRSVQGRSNRVLSAPMVTRMITSGTHGDALGFSAWGSGRAAVFSHGGANDGFRTMLFAYAHTGQGAVVMANGDGGDALLAEILRAIAREYGWPDYRPMEKDVVSLDASIARAYVGTYDADGVTITITRQGEQLFLQASPVGPTPLKLHPSSERRFFILEGDIEVAFMRDHQGRVTALEVHALDTTATARRVD